MAPATPFLNISIVLGAEHTQREPVIIAGNGDFTDANGVTSGSGTAGNPYILENWEISAGNATGILIKNTDAHFVIRNCYIHDSDGGVSLENVRYGRIGDVDLVDNAWGLGIFASSEIVIENSSVVVGNGIGIHLKGTSDSRILNSTISGNSEEGILLEDSSRNVIVNVLVENSPYGIHLYRSDNNTVSNCTLKKNECGIRIEESQDVGLANNTFLDNGSDLCERPPQDVSPPTIADIAHTTSPPFTISARITDDMALQSVALGIFSVEDYRIIQQFGESESLGNETNITLTWHGDQWALTDGVTSRDISIFATGFDRGPITPLVLFDEDGQGGENATLSLAFFDPITLRLENVSLAGPEMTPLAVTPGVSTITPLDLYLREEAMESFFVGIPLESQDPAVNIRWEPSDATFVVRLVDDEYNLCLTSITAPPGDYLLLLGANDASQNQAWCFVNHTLYFGGMAKGNGLAVWGLGGFGATMFGEYVYHENITESSLQFNGSALLSSFFAFLPPLNRTYFSEDLVDLKGELNVSWIHGEERHELILALSSTEKTEGYFFPQYDMYGVGMGPYDPSDAAIWLDPEYATMTFGGSYRNDTYQSQIAGKASLTAIYGPRFGALSPETPTTVGLSLRIETPFATNLFFTWFSENTSMPSPDPTNGHVVTRAAESLDLSFRSRAGVTLPSTPSANFSFGPDNGSEPLTVLFTDLSTSYDGITSWFWSFGDGSTDKRQNPSHTYVQSGTYTVSLTVKEADGDTDTEVKTGCIKVADTEPTARFSASLRSGAEPLTVSFMDLSTSHDGVASWSWSFGDGSTSTERNPKHTFSRDGNYTVSLTVMEADGDSDSEAKTGYIVVGDTPPTAQFSANPDHGVEPLTLNFTDESASYDGIVSWSWSFGDGSTSRQANPKHLYTQDGTYLVSLTVTEGDGDTNKASRSIVVEDTQPEANYSATPREGSEPLSVLFIDKSTSYDGIVLWRWDFGDGSTSTERNPTHVYSAKGSYEVRVTVSEQDGDTDTERRSNSIVIPQILIGPLVSFLSFLFAKAARRRPVQSQTNSKGARETEDNPHCASTHGLGN